MSDNRRIAKNSAILYVRLIITTIVGLFSSRIVLQSLGASDFGLYSVVGGIVVMINLLNTAMVSTSYRFIAFEIGKGDVSGINRVLNISFVIHVCLALVVVLLAETLGSYYIHNFLNVPADRVPDAMFVFRLSVLATVFSIVSIPFQGLLTAQEKFSVRSFIEIIQVLLRLTAAIMLIYYGANRLRLYSVLTAMAIAITSILYIAYCRRKYTSMVLWHFQTDKAKYREMIGFSGWIIVGAAGYMGKVQGAALIINIFFGTILNAAFGIANQVNQFVLLFSRNLGQAAIPQITKNYSSGNIDRMMQLVCYMPKYMFFLMLLPALPILLETDFLLNLWLDKVPEHTTLFCQLMIGGALIDCLNAATPAAVHATGKIKFFTICQSVILLSSLPVAYILFKFNYPPYTILVVYIITTGMNVIVNQILMKRLIHFDAKSFYKASYLKIFYVVVCVSPLFLIKNLFDQGLLRFVFLSFSALVWVAIVIYIVGIERNERLKFKSGIVQLYSRFSQRGVK